MRLIADIFRAAIIEMPNAPAESLAIFHYFLYFSIASADFASASILLTLFRPVIAAFA